MMDKIEEQVSELSSGQENREKVKALSAEIVVHGTTEKPYYEIEYFDLSDRQYHTGYSSYDLNNVFRWREECFEIVKENEYDMISEQVRELREVAEMYDGLDGGDILREAADTIESLSAKLQAANMERSAEDCGEWIPCNKRLPEIGKFVMLSLKNLEVCIGYRENDSLTRMTACLSEKGQRIEFGYVLAWHPIPEPYIEP